jgi:virginiamycin B lyase
MLGSVRRAAARCRLTVLSGAAAAVALVATASPSSAFVDWTNEHCGNSCIGTTIGRANTDGTAAGEDFIRVAKDPIGVAVDIGHLYWANAGTQSIGRANLDGSEIDRNFIPSAGQPLMITPDDRRLYWGSEVRVVILDR